MFRIILYNVIGIAVVGILGILFNLFDSLPWNEEILSFPQLVTTLFLANTVYIIGNLLEALHSKLWNTDKSLVSREKQFFTAALVMIGIVNSATVVIYFFTEVI